MRKIKYFTILLLLLASSSCKDEMEEWQKQEDRPLHPAVMQARNYFEEYVENTELSEQTVGLYPGNFAPDWSKAVVVNDETHLCVNVPIVSDVKYEGSFASGYDAVDGPVGKAYYTAVGQKLLVVKEAGKEYGCYIVSIIPDETNAVKSSDMAARMFNNGDPNTTFSGTTLYTELSADASPVASERYQNGERYAVASQWWNGNRQQLMAQMDAQLGVKQLYVIKKTMGKSSEFVSGWTSSMVGGLPSGGGYSGGGGGGYIGSQGSGSSGGGYIIGYKEVKGGIELITSETDGDSNGSSSSSGGNTYSYTGNTSSGAMVNASGLYDYGSSNYGMGSGSSSQSTHNAGSGSNTVSGNTGNSGNTSTPAKVGDSQPKRPLTSFPTPVNYEHDPEDKFFRLPNGKRAPEIIETQRHIRNCVPTALEYVYWQLFGKPGMRVNGFTRVAEEIIKKYYKGTPIEKEAKKWLVSIDGVPAVCTRHLINQFFTMDLSYEKFEGKYFENIFNKKDAKGNIVPCVVVTSIPAKNPESGKIESHCIVVVGYRRNGDVIFMNPALKSLQVVNPSYISNHVLNEEGKGKNGENIHIITGTK